MHKRSLCGFFIGFCGLALLSGLGGCSTLDGLEAPSLPNPSKWFKGKEKKLPGDRIAVMRADEQTALQPSAAARPVLVPPAQLNSVWSQPGGVASNAPGHLSLTGGLNVRWSSSIGYGSSSKGKLTAVPLVLGSAVYTLDTRGRVSAFTTSSGSRVWSGSLTPPSETDHEGFGGGLAYDGGRLFAATGYGTVSALDPTNGGVAWTVKLGAPIRSAPTAAAGRVFVVTTEGRLVCLAAVDGQQMWEYRGLPESAALITNASPATDSETVVVPFASGEVLAFDVASGSPIWSENLTRRRSSGGGAVAMTNPSRPAIMNGTVYAVGNAGRMVATAVKSGERIWEKNLQGIQTPWVAGDNVFVVDASGRLLAMSRTDGSVLWSKTLQGGSGWTGPVLAGGLLWLVSGKGNVIGVDVTNGNVVTQKDLGRRVEIAPVVANGKMYVLSDGGQLIAVN